MSKDTSVNKSDKTLSKALSWVLRHSANNLGLVLSSDGYVPLTSLLSLTARKLNTYSLEDVKRVVMESDKQRFKIEYKKVKFEDKGKYSFWEGCDDDQCKEELCIRANQGHSIQGIQFDELLTKISPDEIATLEIIHGTYYSVWDKIRLEGLKKMNRNHIHCAPGLPPGKTSGGQKQTVISGMRIDCQIYIYIDGTACYLNGISFYRSENGVLLTSGPIPASCFSKVIDAKTGVDLLDESREQKRIRHT
jgi:2'-phosphotransferase